MLSLAADLASAKLRGSVKDFATPSRFSLWNNIAINYNIPGFQLNASLLYTYAHDKTTTGASATQKNELTPTFSVSLKPGATSPLLFRVFYKRIFRMPTFNDLYYNFIGNISLRPEYTSQYNAGITYSKHFNSGLQQFSISADAYYNNVKDKIVAIPNQNLFVWRMLNLGRVHIKGIEISSEANGKIVRGVSWFCRVAYTWQQALDVTHATGTDYKKRVPYTPDHSGSGLISFKYKNWSTGYALLFSGSRYTLGENNPFNQLDGWATHDIFVSRPVRLSLVNISIKGEIDNVSDKRFDVVRYFPMPGRSFKVSLLFNNL
jgi:outer membrane receptor protein involved in Fe transport